VTGVTGGFREAGEGLLIIMLCIINRKKWISQRFVCIVGFVFCIVGFWFS